MYMYIYKCNYVDMYICIPCDFGCVRTIVENLFDDIYMYVDISMYLYIHMRYIEVYLYIYIPRDFGCIGTIIESLFD